MGVFSRDRSHPKDEEVSSPHSDDASRDASRVKLDGASPSDDASPNEKTSAPPEDNRPDLTALNNWNDMVVSDEDVGVEGKSFSSTAKGASSSVDPTPPQHVAEPMTPQQLSGIVVLSGGLRSSSSTRAPPRGEALVIDATTSAPSTSNCGVPSTNNGIKKMESLVVTAPHETCPTAEEVLFHAQNLKAAGLGREPVLIAPFQRFATVPPFRDLPM